MTVPTNTFQSVVLNEKSLDQARDALRDPSRGYLLFKDFFSTTEVSHYRDECERFITTGPSILCRINTDTMPDYIHPRSHDAVERTYRIYQFFRQSPQLRSPTTSFTGRSRFATRSRSRGWPMTSTVRSGIACRTTSSSPNTWRTRGSSRATTITRATSRTRSSSSSCSSRGPGKTTLRGSSSFTPRGANRSASRTTSG